MLTHITEEAFRTAVADGRTVKEIADLLGCGRETARNRLKKYGLKAKSTRDKLEPGRQFNSLTVAAYKCSNGSTTFYYCDCACGNRCVVRRTDLVGNNQKTCGCSHKKLGKQHFNFAGYEEIGGRYWASLKWGAADRKLKFDITLEYVWKLFLAQRRKCALSKLPISFADRTASLDRINSTRGYVRGNVQWLHKDVNRMKQEFDQSYFVDLCRRIAT